MVIYYKCLVEEYLVYSGKDKSENEKLLHVSFPNDVWFHVDSHSSAHVYLRGKDCEDIFDNLTKELILEIGLLVKDRSIKGRKLTEVKIVFTRRSNLKKTKRMAPGQVSFYNKGLVNKIVITKPEKGTKNRKTLNRIRNTKKEVDVSNEEMKRELEEYMLEQKMKKKQEDKKKKKEEKKKRIQEAKEKKIRNYDGFFNKKKMVSNVEMLKKKDEEKFDSSEEEEYKKNEDDFDSDEDFM